MHASYVYTILFPFPNILDPDKHPMVEQVSLALPLQSSNRYPYQELLELKFWQSTEIKMASFSKGSIQIEMPTEVSDKNC